MPQVDVQDVGLVEFPDDATDQEIQDALNELFPAQQAQPENLLVSPRSQQEILESYFPAAPSAEIPPTIQEPLIDEGIRQLPMRTTTGGEPTPMMAYDIPPEERRQKFKEDILRPIVPLPRLEIDPKESAVTATAKEAVNVLIGIPEFVETPAGIISFGAAAVAPVITAGGFSLDMLHSLGQQIRSSYGNWDKMTPAEKAVAVTDMAGTGAFAALTGGAAARGIGRRFEAPEMKATRELARTLEETQPIIPEVAPTPITRLGIPQAPLTAEPFLQPGIPELAGAALREAQTRLEIPGRQSAIEQLRMAIEPPEILPGEPTRFAGRIPERGGTMVTPTLTGAQVQPRVLRSASDILLERSMREKPSISIPTLTPKTQKGGEPSAIQSETAPVLRDVREPEIPQEGQVQVPVSEGRPQAAEARVTLPELRPGDRPIKIEQTDPQTGKKTIIDAVSTGKNWEFGGQVIPNVGRAVEGMWSDGPLRPGERILEPEQPKGGEPIEEAQRQKEVLEPEPEIEAVTPLDIQSGSPLSATESLINRLEALKFPDKGEGRLYSLPHPDAVKAIGRTAWNTAIDIAIAAVKSGKAIAEAVESALAHIRKNAAGKFDEAQARANLEFVTRAEARPSLPSTEGETVQMRKSAERATTSPMVPEPVQERIAGAPESFYRQQSMKRVEEVIGNLSDAELAGVSRESNLYTASKLEQARRAFDRGDNEAGYRVFEELEKEGTMMGQLINQFKLLKGTRPENIVRVINQKLKKEGKDALNDKQSAEAVKKVTESKEKDAELDKATEAWTKNPTPENAAVAEKALLEANRSALELQRFISRYTPRSTAAIIKSVLQGNLLTPISEVANLVGNMSLLPFRSMYRTVATSFDILDNYIKGTPREITVQPVRGTAEAIKGFGRGVTKIPDIFMRGTGDVIKGETRAGLHPIDAWIKQFAKNPEMPTTGGKLTLQDRLNLAIEGTFGVPAETMLRGLGAGDVAFREAAKSRATATELKLKGVPKDQWDFAQKFPELFLDDAALQRIHTDTLQAIFQRPSRTLNVITNWIRGRGEWFDLAVATVAPYKVTPWNIVGEFLSFNPLLAAARSVNDFRLGNRRSAKLNAGKYVVGTMLTAAGWWLYKNGLMSPSLDQRDEAQKARILAGEVLPPNHINLSGLNRALTGGDPAFKKGDETVDVFRAGGLAGSMFYMTANIGRDFERMPEVQDREVIGAILRQSTLEQARFGMNQSFLSGVEGLLAAIREGNTDSYVRQWANTVASVPMPNSLTVLSRATREYKPDFREDTFRKQVENIARNRLGFANMDDYLPLKRGLWGEPLRETPEGRNALIYHFFDVFKNKQVTGDPVALELFRLWRKTTDTRVIPSLPEKTLTIARKTYALDAAQQSRYAELVGQSRRRIVDAVVVNPEFHKLPDESKITILDRIYRAGLEQGKAKFWTEAHGTLKEKPGRAGFEPGTPQ